MSLVRVVSHSGTPDRTYQSWCGLAMGGSTRGELTHGTHRIHAGAAGGFVSMAK